MSTSKLNIATQLKSISSDDDFWRLAQLTFKFQVEKCLPYREFNASIGLKTELEFPFIPIEAFKWRDLNTEQTFQIEFKSSGTTNHQRSQHRIHSVDLYKGMSVTHFEDIYGNLSDWTILALLPSYLENGDSSLVFMVDEFIKKSNSSYSGFMLNSFDQLRKHLLKLAEGDIKTMLFGVSYALLDFCDCNCVAHKNLIVIETGGMKGRGQELTRQHLHKGLKKGFPESDIHSEYGMTELLSQGYCQDGEWFKLPKWAKAFAVDIADPFKVLQPGERGQLAFIDLANYYSCSFIQTRDIGIVNKQGLFKVEGRIDHSDLRGCNLLYT